MSEFSSWSADPSPEVQGSAQLPDAAEIAAAEAALDALVADDFAAEGPVADDAPVATVPERAGRDVGELEADLAAVDAAIERIDRDAYGRCDVCGLTLDAAVLQADPTVAACPAHIHLRPVTSGS